MRITLLFLLLLSGSAMTGQPSKAIEYDEDGHFNWGMFRGKVNPRHIAEMGKNTGAVTVSSLSYETLDLDREKAVLKVTALFLPWESWTRYPDLPHPDEALNHEKRHFDICEIYARKLRRLILHSRFDIRHFNQDLSTAFRNLVAEYKTTQARYDRETRHSIDRAEQAKWNRRIDSELEALSGYKENVLTIAFH